MRSNGQLLYSRKKGRDITDTKFLFIDDGDNKEIDGADDKKKTTKILKRNTNLRSRGGGTPARIVVAILLVVGLALGSAAFAFSYISKSQNVDRIRGHSSSITTTTTKSEPQVSDLIVSSKTIQVCKNAAWFLTDDLSSIKQVYKDSVAFFDDGGNLQQVTKYLNSHIHSSLLSMHVQFIPEGSDVGLPRKTDIPGTIKALLKEKDTYNRGGYDQHALPGKYWPFDNPYFHPRGAKGGGGGGNRFDVMEPTHQEKRWRAALGPVVPDVCKQVNTIEAEINKYEEKFMCSFEDLKREKALALVAANAISKMEPCGMISIGSNGQWGFENEVSKSTECTIHTFDCTINDPNKPENEAIHFYPYCISDVNKKVDGRQYMTYSKMLEATGMKSPPSLLKMDVEGFEYDVLQQMIIEAEESGSKNLLPTQISVELHYTTRMYDLDWMTRYRQAGELTLFLGFMFRKGGYTIVHTKFNPPWDDPMEVLFVRAFCDE